MFNIVNSIFNNIIIRMAEAPKPKFEAKMLVLPLIMFASRKIDFKDEDVVMKCRVNNNNI